MCSSDLIGETQDMTLEVRVGGFDRKFLLRVVKMKDSPDMYLLAGGTRKNRFDGLVGEFRKAFDSFKRIEDNR